MARLARLILKAWRRATFGVRNRRLVRRLIADERAKAELPHLAFAPGDRVKAVDHRRVDDSGGRGTVVEAGAVNGLIGCRGFLVRFDSMPATPLWMTGSELVYARE